jgi:hypothetical protein
MVPVYRGTGVQGDRGTSLPLEDKRKLIGSAAAAICGWRD